MNRCLAAVLIAGVFTAPTGCDRPPTAAASVVDAPPIDADQVTLADALTWPVQHGLSADLDDDGQDERLVVASDVTAGSDGEPLWEDGHRWAVWVVEPDTDAQGDSLRTLLYGDFVQLGRVDVSVMAPSEGQAPGVFVLERGQAQVAALEVRYDGPGVARSQGSCYFQVQRGVPFP